MFDSHYSSSIDSLSEMEQLLFNYEHVKHMLYFTREKFERGDEFADSLNAAIAFLEYSIERVDLQFPEVWNTVISQHPQRLAFKND